MGRGIQSFPGRWFAAAFCLLLAGCAPLDQAGRPDQTVRIVGSSTVFPFARVVSEHYAVKSASRAPIIEMTGTGGGFQAFCAKDADIHIANASRMIKPSERALCARNGVGDIVEFAIGFDGIVLAGGRDNPLVSLTLDQLYRGLAKDLPTAEGFVKNPHQRWRDVDPALPDVPIEVHGPPPTSGTRDAFVELALEEGARASPALATLAARDKAAFAARAGALREDGVWIDEGENDNAIIQIIRASPYALGVFGYSFYDQNRGLVSGVGLHDAAPSFEAILSGAYPLARSLYFYVAAERADVGVADYAAEFMSEAAIGPYGYVIEKGLIPLTAEERRAGRARARALFRQVKVHTDIDSRTPIGGGAL